MTTNRKYPPAEWGWRCTCGASAIYPDLKAAQDGFKAHVLDAGPHKDYEDVPLFGG